MDPEKLASQTIQRNMSDAGLSLFESSSQNAALYSHYASVASAYQAFGNTAVFPPQFNISSMFGGLGSLSTSMTQPYTSPLVTESRPSSRRKSHPTSLHSLSATKSERESKLTSVTPIYTNPSTGVTITPINYEDRLINSSAKHNGSTLSLLPQSASTVSSERTCKDPHDIFPQGYQLPLCMGDNLSSHRSSPKLSTSKSSGKRSSTTTCNYPRKSASGNMSNARFSELSSVGSDSSEEEMKSSSRSRHKRNTLIDRIKLVDGSDLTSVRSSSPMSTPPSLEPSIDASSGPLNLSTKSQIITEDCLQPPILLPVVSPKQRKIHKSKNNARINENLINQKHLSLGMNRHASSPVQLNQMKQLLKREASSPEISDHKYYGEAASSSFKSSRKTQSPAPQVVISSPNQQQTRSPTPNVVTITALPCSNRGISLLTGAPAKMSPITDVINASNKSSCVNNISTNPKKGMTVDSGGHSSFGTSSADYIFSSMLSKHDHAVEKSDRTSSSKNTDDVKKMAAKFRTIEDDTSADDTSDDNSSDESNSSSQSDSSSSNSESESETSESDTTEQSHINSGQSTPISVTSTSHKRAMNDDSLSSSPIKRRRLMMDEKELRIPLEHGWRRQTKIRTFTYSGARGTVVYFAPCGKKLKTYPEVIRYLDKNGITDITRENFSFSTKVNIGEFLEPIDGGNEYVPLGEQEVIARIDEIRSCKRRRTLNGERIIMNMNIDESRSRSKVRLHKIPDIKLQKKMEREQALMAAKEAKKLQALEVKRHREEIRLLRQKEKYERQEQLKLEKEMKTQQLIEARKKRQEELEKQRIEEATRKAKEMQKRREMLIMVDMERERRRQHMLLVKALESHKKQEERERIKEERKTAKKLDRERKMEQRRLELQVLREMRKPVEDMEIGDAEPLPTLNRIPGVKLPGKAFADILMVVEFLHNFGETLGFDMHHLPTLNTLQMALLNYEEAEEELVSTIHHLVTCAIEDPGVTTDTKHLNILRQPLKEVDITPNTVSEVLRIYIQAQAGENSDMSCWLKEHNFLALNPLKKAAILAYICNELLCSRAICRQIENNIELVNNVRRDRWMVEGKLRKLKTVLGKKISSHKTQAAAEKSNAEENRKQFDIANAKEPDEEDDSGNDSDGSIDTAQRDAEPDEQDEENSMTPDELKKNIDKLNKHVNQCRNKLLKANQQLRAVSFGQDRFKRRYWVLPYAGGVFVEGMESSELPEDCMSSDIADDSVDQADSKSVADTEETENIPQCKIEVDDGADIQPSCDEDAEFKLDVKSESVKVEDNLFLQKPEELRKLSDYIHDSTNTSTPISKCNAEKQLCGCIHYSQVGTNNFNGPVNPNAKDINCAHPNYFKCDTPFYNGNCTGVINFPSTSFCAEAFRSANQKPDLNQKPWFSLLPRMPCDETTLTRVQLPKSNLNSSASKYSPYCAFNMYNSNIPSFASLQMGVINGAPSSFFMGQHQSLLPSSAISSPAPPDSPSGGSVGNGSGLETPSKTIDPLQLMENSITINHSALLNKLHQHAVAQPIPVELQRGWWRITDSNQLKGCMSMLHQRGIRERMLYKQLEKYEEFAYGSCGKGNSEAVDLEITELDRKISQLPGGAPEADDLENWYSEVELRVDLVLLEHIENLEEKIDSASMQKKGWKPSPKATADKKLKFSPACIPPEQRPEDKKQSPLEISIEKLLQLETNIEHRYIKPPLGYNNLNVTSTTLEENAEDDVSLHVDEPPAAMLQWREAVSQAKSSAELAICVSYLENCLAWDKSVMKASCQFCNSGDNEAKLLLCDGCDKGYHMYCFKPKMENIPDGDWFCNECLNKASGDRLCMVCSKKGKNMCICDKCPKAFHIDCLNPPLTRPPKGKWSCSHCIEKTSKSKSKTSGSNRSSGGSSKKKKKKKNETCNTTFEKPVTEKLNTTTETPEKSHNSQDLTPCGTILKELEEHEGAWPFLLPVNTKQFPSYRKVIKKPMDLGSIRTKIQDGSYKSREEFSTDIRLIFNNCETFNEDDSPVGKAGHTMRAFFETRWLSLAEG